MARGDYPDKGETPKKTLCMWRKKPYTTTTKSIRHQPSSPIINELRPWAIARKGTFDVTAANLSQSSP
jgi:hypothetical protein